MKLVKSGDIVIGADADTEVDTNADVDGSADDITAGGKSASPSGMATVENELVG